ncbi:MAG: hypothetical protein NTV01_10395 [Bacteroidia bacterium]|nr:hypothetical protein [Bacteroidia bacterium]
MNFAMPVIPDFSDKATLEKYSSAFSLSDMEIFVFPELLYPLLIANIMSPIIWTWRDDPWFENIHKKSFNYKLNRIKQYIMDHYVFNLDLDTWGLSTKDIEINRFKDFMDMDHLRQSNALFGYQGDKYYFEKDIRRHFGLDKYTSDKIPYWKTETVEAMTAFRFKESFSSGAGECVSFSVLYAAALFIVGRIPLEKIFLMGTPLHSQDFIDINEGVLTNNRRIVTKKMWFNGTALSTRARRAIENEKVTIVSHLSGYIHYMNEKATINVAAYQHFSEKLKKFLTTELSPVAFINFLRYHMNFKKCFQYRHFINGHYYYIALETIFEYEHSTKHSFSETTRNVLINEIEDEEFSLAPLENRIIIQEVEDYLEKIRGADVDTIMNYFVDLAKATKCNNEGNIKLLFNDLAKFLNVQPQLPATNKKFVQNEVLNININQTRQDILQLISAKASYHEVALLSLYAYRQMDKIDWKPFVKAALERNPVSLEGLKGRKADAVYQLISGMPNESIYDTQRLAQPDEVWNFGRGDGVEKALLFANYLCNESNQYDLWLIVENANVTLESNQVKYVFHSTKDLVRRMNLMG